MVTDAPFRAFPCWSTIVPSSFDAEDCACNAAPQSSTSTDKAKANRRRRPLKKLCIKMNLQIVFITKGIACPLEHTLYFCHASSEAINPM
jgi:hypothetical protein